MRHQYIDYPLRVKQIQRQKGFSLIEIMLVVFIVAMMAAGVTIFATRDTIESQIMAQQQILQNTIRQVQSKAMIHRKYYGLTLHEGGWRVMQIEPDEDFLTWGTDFSPINTANTATNQSQQKSSVGSKGLPWSTVKEKSTEYTIPKTLEMSLMFDDSDSSMLAMKDSEPPQIIVSAQGEVTPFMLLFRGVKNDIEIVLEVYGDGRVVNAEALTQ